MKIASLKAEILSIPEDDPLADSPERAGATRPVVALRMRTDDGIEGIGISFFAGKLTGALRTAIEALGEAIVGHDPLRPEAIIAKLREAAGGCEPGGIFTLASAAIDIALWDIKGKALGQPIWKLLGGARNRVPTYASGAQRRGLSDRRSRRPRAAGGQGVSPDEDADGAARRPTIADEVRRARMIRDAAGPDIELMCDINQRWRVEQAIDIGRRVEDVGVGFLARGRDGGG